MHNLLQEVEWLKKRVVEKDNQIRKMQLDALAMVEEKFALKGHLLISEQEKGHVQKQLDEFRRQVADLFHHWASVQKAQLVQQEDIFEVACMADTTKVLCYSLEDDVARLN